MAILSTSIYKRYLTPVGLASALMALTGCYTDFTPDIESEPVLCLNALITAGESVEADITRTWLYTDVSSEKDHSVADASLTVYVNGMKAPDGYQAQAGDRIRLVASSNRYGLAEAEVEVPPAAPIDSMTAEPVMTRIGYQQWTDEDCPDSVFTAIDFTFRLAVDLKVSDPGQGRNYFRVRSVPLYEGEPYSYMTSGHNYISFYPGSLNYDIEPIFSEHISAIEALSGSLVSGFNFFTDRSFESGSYTLHLRYENASVSIRYLTPADEADNVFDKLDFAVTMILEATSESMFNWGNYAWQMDEGLLGDLGNIGLGKPVWGYSNVSTGAGVVAARSMNSRVIDLQSFFVDTLRKALEDKKD